MASQRPQVCLPSFKGETASEPVADSVHYYQAHYRLYGRACSRGEYRIACRWQENTSTAVNALLVRFWFVAATDSIGRERLRAIVGAFLHVNGRSCALLGSATGTLKRWRFAGLWPSWRPFRGGTAMHGRFVDSSLPVVLWFDVVSRCYRYSTVCNAPHSHQDPSKGKQCILHASASASA